MTHDPLCADPDHPLPRKCVDCNLIREVREDERANVTAEFMSNHGDRWEYGQGQRDMLAKCIESVKRVGDRADSWEDYFIAIVDATNALRALQEKP